MNASTSTTRFRFWLWLLRLIGVIVPRGLRADWRQEWEAELRHREEMLAEWDRLNWRNKLDLLWRSISAFWDALWLQTYRWEDEMFQDLRYGWRMLFKNPHAQSPNEDAMAMVVRADAAELSSLRSAIQQELKQLDPALPVANVRAMTERVATALAKPRFNTLLRGLFGATALLLTAVGLYGVVAYGVNQRTREIGIRMALGAKRTNVLALAIRQGMQPALMGLCVGLVGALGLMRLLTSQLYEVQPTDPVTFIPVGFGLFVIALAACYFPARRATKVDPMLALRCE